MTKRSRKISLPRRNERRVLLSEVVDYVNELAEDFDSDCASCGSHSHDVVKYVARMVSQKLGGNDKRERLPRPT